MEIKDILSLDCTRCAVPLTSKKRVLQYISTVASEKLSHLDEAEILNSLICREKMGSTGIGNGIAIPHGRISGIDTPIAVVVTSQTGIDFESIDNQMVDIFFAIMVPADKAEGHLQTLARIAQTLSNKDVIKNIRKANSDQLLYEILQ